GLNYGIHGTTHLLLSVLRLPRPMRPEPINNLMLFHASATTNAKTSLIALMLVWYAGDSPVWWFNTSCQAVSPTKTVPAL
ncbi:MAG: hypothetical protein IKG22_00605, partial [Atopobiaceae bacterium]|nr:hypothetical protein [Atopobiaceae bacterium]